MTLNLSTRKDGTSLASLALFKLSHLHPPPLQLKPQSLNMLQFRLQRSPPYRFLQNWNGPKDLLCIFMAHRVLITG